MPGKRTFGLLLVCGAVIGLVGNGLHPHSVDSDKVAFFTEIAGSSSWVAIHLAIIVAVLLLAVGLVGVTDVLTAESPAPFARIGLLAGVAGSLLVSVSTAIDGFAIKRLAVHWSEAPALERETALRVAVAVQETDFAIWSVGMLVLFGAAFLCFGVALVRSERFPAVFGWAALAGGTGSSVAALLQIAAGDEVQTAETMFLVSSLLITAWAFGIGLILLRTPRATATAGHTE